MFIKVQYMMQINQGFSPPEVCLATPLREQEEQYQKKEERGKWKEKDGANRPLKGARRQVKAN